MEKPFYLLIFVLLFSMCSIVFAENLRYSWGGSGFDPELKQYDSSSRFFAQGHPGERQLIDVGVDSREAQQGISLMRLISAQGIQIDSDECWKSMRHITAPSVCSFVRTDFENLQGMGRMEIFNKENVKIIVEDVDFDAMRGKLEVK